MSKKLNLPSALGIFLIGIFSANISQAQYTNAYWDVNGVTAGEGGTGTFSSSGVLWTTNSVNATAATGGPTGGGLFALVNGPAGTATANNSGGYNINFGGGAGSVKQGGAYEAASVNFLSSGYNWWVDAGAARTITTTNGVNLNGNALTLSNGTTGVNSFTFSGNTSVGAVGITGSTGASLALKNNAAFTAGTSAFGVYLSGGTISSNIGINVDIGTGSKILFGTQSGLGATIAANITNNSASGVALNITNSGTNALTLSGAISGANGLVLDSTNTAGRIQITGLTNSFGGGISLGSGVLYFNSFGVAGQNSSLGTNGTIKMAGAGTLRWTGSSNEISDKTISLTGATGSYALLANGATNGSLTLNGNINSAGAGAKTLTFGGYATNTLTLNGVINENGGVNSVVIGTSSSGTVVLGNANNSFSGAITVTNSTSGQSTYLSTANIGNANANSALGKNGTINIGSGSSGALTGLKYTGTGEVSDKVINLAGTSGGAILDQSGTGNLKFTSAMTATGVGAKAITLQGSTTGTGELAGAISNLNGNVISLNKYGSGDWTLSGNNSYSGNTTIRDTGVLKVTSVGALSQKSSLLGSSSGSTVGTLDLTAGGDYVANSFGTSATGGFNMNFNNSSGSAATLRFTNAENYVTVAANNSGGRTLLNQSSNLDVKFDGNIEIGSSSNDVVAFGGAGNFWVDGSIKNSGAGVRGLEKTGNGTLTLAGSENNYNGSTSLKTGTLSLLGSLTGSTDVKVGTSGSGAVSTASTTRTATATLEVKSGATLLNNSTTTVYSGGNMIVNGTAGSVVVESNGLLGGSGTNNGVVTLMSGSLLNPGNSPGKLTAADTIWKSGSTYNWEIDNADGTAGTNWDLFSVTGALDLSALSSTAQMNLVLESLSIANFSTTSSYTWVIAQAGSFIGTGLADGTNVTDLFNINATAFNGGLAADLPNGGFKVEVGTDANNLRTLNLMAIPEPSTGSLMMFGLSGLVLTRLLRRKVS